MKVRATWFLRTEDGPDIYKDLRRDNDIHDQIQTRRVLGALVLHSSAPVPVIRVSESCPVAGILLFHTAYAFAFKKEKLVTLFWNIHSLFQPRTRF